MNTKYKIVRSKRNKCGCEYEHRQIVESHLGRRLSSTEIIHHKNGDTKDNRIKNLEVLDRATHNRKHGRGRLLTCIQCKKETWWGPYNLKKRNPNSLEYRCRNCSREATYFKKCFRCKSEFYGAMNSYLCKNCQSNGGRTKRKHSV